MVLLIGGCFLLLLVAIVMAVVVMLVARQGQGVSDARSGWIEGTAYRDDD